MLASQAFVLTRGIVTWETPPDLKQLQSCAYHSSIKGCNGGGCGPYSVGNIAAHYIPTCF